MQTKFAPAAPPKVVKTVPKQETVEGSSSDIVVKIAIPLVLAFVAAALNASAVARQMKTQPFLAYKEDLPIGHIIKNSDLVEVKIGGDLGQIPYHRPSENAASELIGRVINRPVKKGELIVESQFGGISVPDLGKYRSFELPRNLSRTLARSVRPGQWFTIRYALKNNTDKVYELGPFEVAPVDQNYRLDSVDAVTVLNLKMNEDTDRQIFMLQEVLEESNKYTHQCVPLSTTPRTPGKSIKETK